MTAVVDSSVVVDAALGGGAAQRVIRAAGVVRLHAPALLHAEVTQVLRRANRRGELPDDVAGDVLDGALAIPVHVHAFLPFADRVWELRENVSAYDAWYVALAEALGAPLLTLDARLARAPGLGCEVRLVG